MQKILTLLFSVFLLTSCSIFGEIVKNSKTNTQRSDNVKSVKLTRDEPKAF